MDISQSPDIPEVIAKRVKNLDEKSKYVYALFIVQQFTQNNHIKISNLSMTTNTSVFYYRETKMYWWARGFELMRYLFFPVSYTFSIITGFQYGGVFIVLKWCY